MTAVESRLGERGGSHHGIGRELEILFSVAQAVGLEVDDFAIMEERDAGTGHMRGLDQSVNGRIDLRWCNVAPVEASDCWLLRARGCSHHQKENWDIQGSIQAGISLNAETLKLEHKFPPAHIIL